MFKKQIVISTLRPNGISANVSAAAFLRSHLFTQIDPLEIRNGNQNLPKIDAALHLVSILADTVKETVHRTHSQVFFVEGPQGKVPTSAAPSVSTKSGPIPTEGLTYTDGKTHVLLIGVNNYPTPEPRVEGREHLQSVSFSNLRYCAKDMEELKKALVQARFCNEGDVQLLVSGAGGSNEPTRANVDTAFQRLLHKIGPGDRVLVAFSGRGFALPSEERTNAPEAVLACADARVIYDSSPHESRFTVREGIISLTQLEEALDASQAGPKLVFIDTCRNMIETIDHAKGTEGLPKFEFGEIGGIFSNIKNKSGLFRFASCLPGESSFEFREIEHGVFAHFIIKGLQGAAPQRLPGRITLDDLYRYVRRETRKYINADISTSRSQTPVMFVLPHFEGGPDAENIVMAYYTVVQEQDGANPVRLEKVPR